MTKKVYKIAIIGAGMRGANVYGEIIKSMPEMFEITAVYHKLAIDYYCIMQW